MRNLLLLFVFLTFTYCDSYVPGQQDKNREKTKIFNTSVAVKFMDDYAKFCNRQGDRNEWIKNNSLLTDKFKSEFKKFIDSSPQLDFDPIFDAQDYPDKGFEVLKSDSVSGFVTLNGKDWQQFTVIVKIANKGDTWLVDGAGIINMPKDMQRKERQ